MNTESKEINISEKIKIGGSQPLFLIGGPCVIENEEHAVFLATQIKNVCDNLGIPYIFKASYDKANRSSLASYRGPGFPEGLQILDNIKNTLNVPVLSDVHEMESRGSSPAMTPSRSALSVTSFVRGPIWSSDEANATRPYRETRP